MDQLHGRLEQESQPPVVAPLHAPKVGLVGPNLLALEQQAAQGHLRPRLEVTSRWANMEAFEAEQTGTDAPQVLILQLPVLNTQAIDLAKEIFPKAKLVVIYQFATSPSIADLTRAAIPTLKWPVTWAEIEHLSINEAGQMTRPLDAVPRRFSDEELIAIASEHNDATNCPQYLIEAIHQLNALAAYAQDCALAVDRPQTYTRAGADASQARAQLEAALATLTDLDE